MPCHHAYIRPSSQHRCHHHCCNCCQPVWCYPTHWQPWYPIPQYGSLVFQKRNATDSAPLAGAVFTIYSNGTVIATATSGANGSVEFASLPYGTYTLVETASPSGYEPNSTVYSVVISQNGSTIDGLPASSYQVLNAPTQTAGSLRFTKNNIYGDLMPGVGFTLYEDGTAISTVYSQALGIVDFGPLAFGTYTLRETVPPIDYEPNLNIYNVIVSSDGTTINGQPDDGFVITNVPSGPSPGDFVLSFSKYNSSYDPVSGATFTLYDNGTAIASATSGIDGTVNFGTLGPGTYTMVETASPPGYAPNSTVYTVRVDAIGIVTIDNALASSVVILNF